MNQEAAVEPRRDRGLEAQGERLLTDWRQARESRFADGPSLVIFNRAAPGPDLLALGLSSGALSLRLAWSGPGEVEQRGATVARACSRALPFQNAIFAAVVLYHVVARGDEPELAEACRLLHPGGRLLVVGLNCAGLRYWRSRRTMGLPGMRPLAIRGRLEDLEMNVLGLYATGFLNSDRPRRMNQGLARVLVPVADMLMIVARPEEPKIMNPLARSRVRAVGAPSALAGR